MSRTTNDDCYIFSYSYFTTGDKEVSGEMTVRASCLSLAFSKLASSIILYSNYRSFLNITHIGYVIFVGDGTKTAKVYFKPENRND